MPHRDLKTEERRWNGAQVQGEGDRHGKDSTGSAARNRAVSSTPEGRKSGWVRLADVISAAPWAEPGADPLLRDLLEAGRHVDAEEGDGAAAFLPSGEVILFHVSADGLEVRRNVPADEVALFLSGAREAA